jgi:hypothetical protein
MKNNAQHETPTGTEAADAMRLATRCSTEGKFVVSARADERMRER